MSVAELSRPVPEQIKRGPLLTRRRFLIGLAAIATGGLAAREDLREATQQIAQTGFEVGKAALFSPDVWRLLREDERKPNGPPFAEFASYDQHKDRKLQTVVVGDSIGRGRLDVVAEQNGKTIFTQAPKQYSVATAKIQYINDCESADISPFWHNNAQDGSTAKDTVRQFQTLEIDRTPGITTDFIVSVGGNDAKKALAKAWEHMHQPDDKIALTDNNLILLSQAITESVETFKIDFDTILTKIEDENPNEVFIESLPDASHLPYLQLPDGSAISMQGSGIQQQLTRFFAGRVALLMNNAMIDVIQKRGNSTSYNVIFMNNYALLKDEDFTGGHPNKQGQQKMANEQLRRSKLRLVNGEKATLFDLCQAA